MKLSSLFANIAVHGLDRKEIQNKKLMRIEIITLKTVRVMNQMLYTGNIEFDVLIFKYVIVTQRHFFSFSLSFFLRNYHFFTTRRTHVFVERLLINIKDRCFTFCIGK